MANRDLLRRIAEMSFQDGFTIPEIAAHLAGAGDRRHGTVKAVSKLLAESTKWLLAREKKLADYEADTINYALGDDLRKKYKVLEAVFIPRSSPISKDAPWEPILDQTEARLAAQYFDSVTSDETAGEIRVALSGGEKLLDMAVALPHHSRPHINFYAAALIGRGRMLRATHVGPETVAAVCWLQSGLVSGNLHYATVAPPDLSGKNADPGRHVAAKRDLRTSSELNRGSALVSAVLRDLGDVNMVISDIGTLNPRTRLPQFESDLLGLPALLRSYGVDPLILTQEGAVGYMSYAIFDDEGQSRDDWQFFLGAGYPDTLGFYRTLVKNKQKVVVIADGQADAALRAALKGQLFNVLIADELAAYQLLNDVPPKWRAPKPLLPRS